MGQEKEIADSNEEEYLKEIEPLLHDLGFDVHTIFPDRDWLYAVIDSHKEHNNFTKSQSKREITERMKTNNKGFVVRECLKRFKESGSDVVLHIDGNKAFYLKSIVDVAQNFIEPSIDAVLTVRKNNTGIEKPRELIEDFEKFVVSKSFDGKRIPDGQSGCWGFRYKNEIRITAKGYEIELDILIELFRLNANILWKDINLLPREPSQFDFIKASIEKMKFIMDKLGISRSIILSLLQKFMKLNSEQIKEIDEEEIRNGGDKTFSNYEKKLKISIKS